MPWIKNIGTLSSFQRKEYDIYYWKIDGFSAVSEKAAVDGYYESSYLEYRGLKDVTSWLRFYPNGTRDTPGFIGLCFHSEYPKESSCVHLMLGVKTRSGRIEKWFSSYTSFPPKNELDVLTLIRRSEFLKRKEELAPSDCLTLVVILSPDSVKVTQDVGDRTETAEEEKEDEEKKGVEKVLADMTKLLASGDKSDVTIVVGETEFKVHSCILAARTPVFAALFEHDTVEKETRKVTITDCEAAIFKEFLNYIYAGSVQHLNAENCMGVYRVADKYLVKDLKEVCRSCIADSLRLETFCEVIQMALLCKDEDLLEFAFAYFAKNFRLIIRSVEWQRYIEENPREANEIFIRSFGPP